MALSPKPARPLPTICKKSGIVNPVSMEGDKDKDMLGLIYTAEVLLGKDEMRMGYLYAYREGLSGS